MFPWNNLYLDLFNTCNGSLIIANESIENYSKKFLCNSSLVLSPSNA